VQWQQPPTGFLKCNVDASFFHSNGATGWGWCLRDSRGYFKLAGTNVVNSPLNVLVGEALAIIEAMEEVIQRGIPLQKTCHLAGVILRRFYKTPGMLLKIY
jgi:hypothetical protein